jgi:hypothetical protein
MLVVARLGRGTKIKEFIINKKVLNVKHVKQVKYLNEDFANFQTALNIFCLRFI